jgi:hypothetical protein
MAKRVTTMNAQRMRYCFIAVQRSNRLAIKTVSVDTGWDYKNRARIVRNIHHICVVPHAVLATVESSPIRAYVELKVRMFLRHKKNSVSIREHLSLCYVIRRLQKSVNEFKPRIFRLCVFGTSVI